MKQLGFVEKIEPTTEPQECPCCGQLVKVYRRNIASGVASDLIAFANRTQQGEYMHISKITKRSSGGGDFAKMQMWGLITEHQNTDTGKRTSGLWCVTQKGRDYVNNKIQLPKYALVYNGKFLGYDGDDISIEECLGTKFNYRELMTA